MAKRRYRVFGKLRRGWVEEYARAQPKRGRVVRVSRPGETLDDVLDRLAPEIPPGFHEYRDTWDEDYGFDDGGDDDGDSGDLPSYGERDAEMFKGAQELYEGIYTREEITEYIDDLADYFDMDAHDLYDMFYGYSEAEAA